VSSLDDQSNLVIVTIHSVAEAKTHLSRLLDAALAGDDVIVSRAGVPVVRLVPIEPPAARNLGFIEMTMPDERFDPLGDDELAGWT
jgi:prevent-host-death family protein